MAKRTLETVELENGQCDIPKEGPTKKKNRKRKLATELREERAVSTGAFESESQKRLSFGKSGRLDKSRSCGDSSSCQPIGLKDETRSARKAAKAAMKALKRGQRQDHSQPAKTDASSSTIRTVSSHSNLPRIYTEDTELAGLSQARIDNFVAENLISVTDSISSIQRYRPIIEFSYLPFKDYIQKAPFKAFKAPTPIQAAAWPFLLAGRDVIGIAETGSGKTMAFAVPCVHHLTSLPNDFPHAKAVILSPTRELAIQSCEQITRFTSGAGLMAVCVYGGVPKHEQRVSLKTADIIVATPGRLNDLINEGCADLSKVSYVVLDEADRMLDKGFEDEIRKIIKTTSPLGKRQTLMFTATWPESVRSLAATFMTSPVKITIGDNPTGDLRANTRIVQKVEVVCPRSKESRLLQLLKQYQSGIQKDDRILVFCLYKKEAARVESFIRSKGIRVAGIHGDLCQEQRTRSLDAFKNGNTPVLVATDVAARGLDIPAVKLVINCTFPLTVEDYVHRIGRTGRAGREGLAITLFTEHDKAHSGA
jgi:ATP-dependent RNA helicase DBP3